MQRLIFLFFALVSLTSFGQSENKLIVFSGSDWCNSCLKFKKVVLDKPEVKKYLSENFVLVIADFPRDESKLTKEEIKRNEKLADAYNPSGVFPAMVVVKSDKQVAKKEGYRGELPQEFITWLKESAE